MEKDSKILVTGHSGLVGSAIVRRLKAEDFKRVIMVSHESCDIKDYNAVYSVWEAIRPDYVINCAGKVGGINANNTRGGEFIYDNLMIQTNVIEMSRVFRVEKLLNMGSSCIYPRDCPQPIREEYLMSAPLERTNEGYAVAKIAGITMCQQYRKQYGCNFISVMPTNLYGINDNFNLKTSHALPAAIRKLHEAKMNGKTQVEFFGTGTPYREWMFVDDLADAVVFLMDNYNEADHINIGTGEDMQIKDTINIIADIAGFRGDIIFNPSFPDGTPRKLLDVSKLHNIGWRHKTTFMEGIKKTYEWFKDNYNNARL